MRNVAFFCLTACFVCFVHASHVQDIAVDSSVASKVPTIGIQAVEKKPQPTPPTSSSTSDTPRVWNLNNAPIRSVITEVARVTGKNFLIDPRVQGNVSIVSSETLSNQELYQVFLSMLQVAGYAAVPSDHVTKIVPIIDARGESTDGSANGRHLAQGGDALMVQVIPVRYGSAEQLVPILRSLMPQWSTVSAYTPSNMLILSGRANNIKQLASIINQVDNSSVNGIDIVPLHHALAMDVVATLKDLVKSNQQSALAADDRSNSILLGGTKPERLKMRLLISQLDKRSANGGDSNTQVIYLNYLRAEDVVPILAGIAQASFSGTVGTTIGTVSQQTIDSTSPESSLVGGSNGVGMSPSASTMNRLSPNSTPSTTQSQGTTKPTIQIIAEPNTNAVIVNAPVTVIRMLKTVVNKLDIKPAQLLIEALVAEINERDFQDLGIEWGSKNNDVFRPGFAIVNNTSISSLQAQIYALARQRKANILSTPSVVVLDNRQAKILIGKQVSVATSSYPNNAQGTTAGSPFTTFDRMNVALHLYVRPQITRGQGIQMQIDQGNDSLDPSITSDSSSYNPTFNISAIMTSVHVESGDVIVLGGLAQDSLANDNESLPILGNIPGIGRMFQRNIMNREKKILMVFIRPLILHTEHEGIQASNGKYQSTRQEQLAISRFQEEFDQRNRDNVLPPLHDKKLPKPFFQAANTSRHLMK